MSLADNTSEVSTDQSVQRFGYRQEFKREIKRFASFSVGFSFISISMGIFDPPSKRDYAMVAELGQPRQSPGADLAAGARG